MNTSLPLFSLVRTAVLAAVTCVCTAALADKKAAANQSATVRPQSNFENNPDNGKDPFYPNSTRRRQMIVRLVPTNAPPPVSFEGSVALKGISGSKSQPLALINTTTVGLGEAADVKFGNQAVRLRCLEIRDRSVLIEIVATGEIRELKLREGI